MIPLCSILIPSRARKERLLAAIDSIISGADKPDEMEILVRIDNDDASMDDVGVFGDKVKTFWMGERGSGYANHPTFYTELSSMAQGKWTWIMNDDCIVSGSWMEQLRSQEPAWVVPEVHVRGASVYMKHCGDIGFPLVPTRCWEQYGWTTLPTNPDRELHKLLVLENAWPTVFLKGVTFNHQRDCDSDLERHRKI